MSATVSPTQNLPTTAKMNALTADELTAEADEPPDFAKKPVPSSTLTSTNHSPTSPVFSNARYSMSRRESLLTQAFHLTESKVNSHNSSQPSSETSPGFRSTFTWSSASTGSIADLTSDDGLMSPGMRTSSPSPPLPSNVTYQLPQASIKPLDTIAHEDQLRRGSAIAINPGLSAETGPERSVDAVLGRKRCITFACGKKDAATESTPRQASVMPAPSAEQSTTPAPRKCALRFICPTRTAQESNNINVATPKPRTLSTPPSKSQRRRSSASLRASQQHNGSPNVIVKQSSTKSSQPAVDAASKPKRQPTEDDLGHTAANTFHEFLSSESEEEEWLYESTCHKSRLTLDDTLSKETEIRKTCQAAEDEDELDEEDIDNEEDDDENLDVDVASSQVVSIFDEDEESDEGFHSDDENGFASSDESDGEDEFAWWAPGRSTAATSTDELEALNKLDGCTHIRPASRRSHSGSSIGSFTNELRARSPAKRKIKEKSKNLKAINIGSAMPDLPDSTDFVCGTFDEDRPLEEAYILRKEQRKAKKFNPQDIDPSFPTSDPEMEEEDEDDADDYDVAQESDHPFMHGQLEFTDMEVRGRSVQEWRSQSVRRSPSKRRVTPPPPVNVKMVHHSPPPAQHQSDRPGPPLSRRSTHRSPPPVSRRTTNRSPPPLSRRSTNRSPPPMSRRPTLRSPPPSNMLFGSSPHRHRSPIPANRVRSPPPSRRNSFDAKEDMKHPAINVKMALAQRPQPMHTSSLPRTPNPMFVDTDPFSMPDDDLNVRSNRRGAIDIVKGLEQKRQRRKEKLFQKMCSRAHKKEEKKCRPGKGAEKMREVGLEMAAYKKGCAAAAWAFWKGNDGGDKTGEYILSV